MPKYSFPVGEVAESIATALSIASREPVDKGQVVVEPTGQAGRFLITVYESAEFASKVIPYLDKHGSIPTSIGELCTVGYRTNRKPAQMNLLQHGQVIGASTSGKSSLIHIMLAHATRCPDCFIWIGGVWKLWDFVSAWVEPYLDTGIKAPIDWIAHGHQDVCNMIAAFLNGAAYRMNIRPVSKREHLPAGILILDEVTYLVQNRMVKAIYGGEEKGASTLIADVARGTAGANMYEWLSTQRDTQDNLGDEGGTTAAMMGFAFIFRIRDHLSIGRVTGRYDLDIPANTGECWADLGPGNPILKLRIPYAQDPGKRKLHDGLTLSDISWSRRDIPHEVDEGTAQAFGKDYANRHQYVTEEFLDYLTTPQTATNTPVAGVVPTSMNSLLSPASEAELMEAETKFLRMQAYETNKHEANNGDGNYTEVESYSPQIETQASNGHEVTATADKYTTRAARVQAVVVDNDINGRNPMSRGEIIDKLKEDFNDIVRNPNVVTNILGDLMKCEPPVISKTEDDRYYSL
jgi:hypothetical protein